MMVMVGDGGVCGGDGDPSYRSIGATLSTRHRQGGKGKHRPPITKGKNERLMAITSDERRCILMRKRPENSYADVTLGPACSLRNQSKRKRKEM